MCDAHVALFFSSFKTSICFLASRKEVLLEQSRHWIATEAELESRIDAAVENPEPLWVSEKVARKA